MNFTFPPISQLPFPQGFSHVNQLKSGQPVVVRPARPTDILAIREYIARISEEDRVSRYLNTLSLEYLQRSERLDKIYHQTLDYESHMAFVVIAITGEIIGVSHAYRTEEDTYEVSYSRDSSLRNNGIGIMLMEHILAWGYSVNVRYFEAITLRENEPMRDLFERFGFSKEPYPEDMTLVKYLFCFGQRPEVLAA